LSTIKKVFPGRGLGFARGPWLGLQDLVLTKAQGGGRNEFPQHEMSVDKYRP
jgi:hypothetical protein